MKTGVRLYIHKGTLVCIFVKPRTTAPFHNVHVSGLPFCLPITLLVYACRHSTEYCQYSRQHLPHHHSTRAKTVQVREQHHTYTCIYQPCGKCRKRSPAHQGIIYLLMPKEMVNDDEWGTTRGESISPRPHDPPELLHLAEGGDDGCGLDDDDMKEHSLSMPASPTLHHRPLHSHGRVQRQHSQSFDDILSSVNNEEDLLPSPSPITVGKSSSWNRSRGRNVEIPPPLLSSGSDSDEEPHPQPQCGLGVAYNHTLLVSSQPEITPSSSLPLKGTGKFNQLRGKLFQKVRREKNLQVPQQSTHSDRATSGSGSDTGGQPDNTETSSLNQLSHMTNRLLAVGQRFRNSPPSLLRRMGVGGRGQTTIQAPPEVGNKLQETRSEARNKSQTTFITL